GDRVGVAGVEDEHPAGVDVVHVADVAIAHDPAQHHGAGGLLHRTGVLEQLQAEGVDDPGGAVGPLDVPADPEEAVGDPAEHQRSSSAMSFSVVSLSVRVDCAWACSARLVPTQMTSRSSRSCGSRWFRPASTQVSLEPPPWLELTTSWPSGSATRVSPPGSTVTSSPSLTAKGRRSTCRGRSPPSMRVGTVDSCTTGCAIQPRGSCSNFARRESSSSPVASGPMTRPLPPDPSTGLTTISSSRPSTSCSAAGSLSR